MTNASRDEQPQKAARPISVTVAGRSSALSDTQPEKARSPTAFSPSSRVTSFSARHSSNAPAPILRSEKGIEIDWRLPQ